MKAPDLARLVFLAALWGGSFIFIRIAAPVLGPIVPFSMPRRLAIDHSSL